MLNRFGREICHRFPEKPRDPKPILTITGKQALDDLNRALQFDVATVASTHEPREESHEQGEVTELDEGHVNR